MSNRHCPGWGARSRCSRRTLPPPQSTAHSVTILMQAERLARGEPIEIVRTQGEMVRLSQFDQLARLSESEQFNQISVRSARLFRLDTVPNRLRQGQVGQHHPLHCSSSLRGLSFRRRLNRRVEGDSFDGFLIPVILFDSEPPCPSDRPASYQRPGFV